MYNTKYSSNNIKFNNNCNNNNYNNFNNNNNNSNKIKHNIIILNFNKIK